MAGTRAKIRCRKHSGNHALKLICGALAAIVAFALATFIGLDRNRVVVATVGLNEPIDFSSLSTTVIPLDEFGAIGNNPAVIASSSLHLSTTAAMKSNFMRMTAVPGLVSAYAT
ncbi:MAG: hypothetical protein ACREDW_10585, partial [Aestuariivirgaceae bacterium]